MSVSRRRDILAGLSVAGLLLPEAVAYATIAGLAPQHAILAALAGLAVYALLGRSNYAVTLTSNRLTLTPDKLAAMTVSCSANAIPLPDCRIGPGPGGGATQSVQGWVGQDIQVTGGPGAVGNTVEVTFNIINPFEIQRAIGPSAFSENYRAIFTLNRGEPDP